VLHAVHTLKGNTLSKRQLKLLVRLPEYQYPRNAWRIAIHKAVTKKLKETNVSYTTDDKLELIIRLYFDKTKLSFVDIDNRVKDIMDALQGHVGGAGKKQPLLKPIIPNDSQIYRIIAEKSLPPKQSHGLGHLIIRKYREQNFL
jgi:Holliday junction resolvase RusA-like endonuclease